MPQPKKKIPDAFDFFVREFKEKQKERGVVFLRGEEELIEKAALMWNDMESRQKFVFEEKARKKEKLRKADCKEKIAAQGKHCAQVPRKEKLPVQWQVRVAQEIVRPVLLLDSRASLTTYPFHIAHVNYFCELRNGTYTACEMAIAEFTFADGVRKTYHTLINPGAVPVGFTFEAEQHSTETHNIPLPPTDFGGETNYQKIVRNIKQLLMGENGNESKLPPLYARPSDIDVVNSVLWEFQKCVASKVQPKDVFHVKSLPELFYDLWTASLSIAGASRFPAFGCAERELDNDVHEFTNGISCSFHEETDAWRHCSLSCVRRWSFLILKHCCQALDIGMIPGKHCPKICQKLRNPNTADCDSRAPSDVPGQPLSSEKECEEKATFQKEEQIQLPQEKILKPLRRPKTRPVALELMSRANKKEDIPVVPPSHHCSDQESRPQFIPGSIAPDLEAMKHL